MTNYTLTKVLDKLKICHTNKNIHITTKSGRYYITQYRAFLECNDNKECKYDIINPPIMIVTDNTTIYINLDDIECIII